MRKSISLLMILLVALMLTACKKNKEEVELKEEVVEEEVVEVIEIEAEPDFEEGKSLTTGFDLSESNGHIFGVMVENSPKSRPHTGLIDADVVYEMEVEYNITRFFAIFNDEVPEKVGPVRSARHYYLPIASSWNKEMPYIHYGGSKFAYNDIKETKLVDIDGTKKGYSKFERDNTRKAPHNAYLITDRLELNDFPEVEKNPHFGFTDKIEREGGNVVKQIDIDYYSGNKTTYSYDESEKQYYRFIQGEEHIDRDTKEKIKVKNVFILYAEQEDLNTEGRHIDIHFDGSGDLSYYVEGKRYFGKWKNENGDLKFYYDDGEEIKVLPGKTWIQVVNQDKKSNVVEG